MIIAAIDPGTTKSALVVYDATTRRVVFNLYSSNESLLTRLRLRRNGSLSVADRLAIEMIASYGMPVGADVFATCAWIGRFEEAWEFAAGDSTTIRVFRKDVKMHLCHQVKGVDDGVIRQRIIDLFGPGKDVAIGTKRAPGPLYGITGDEWQALGVALTAAARLRSPVQTQATLPAVELEPPAEDGFTYPGHAADDEAP